MKKITLIRHAKSSWDDISMSDHDRVLDSRGLRDAPFMAQMMASRGWLPDMLMSSTAQRAQSTAQHFAAALGRPASSIQLEKRIYEASMPTILQLIAQLPADCNDVALFGHNPTFTLVANLFYENDYLANLSTCGIVEIVAAAATDWAQFTPDFAKVTDIHYPKQY